MSQQEDQQEPEIFSRIKVLTGAARTNWLGLLAYLSFVGITLLGVKDVDFFIPERETMLPLIGISVPTSLFFYIAPLLGAMLYIHLHLYLLKLWKALAELSVTDTAYGERISPWIVNDMALAMRSGDSHTYPLRRLANTVAFLSIFLAGPVVLAAFWWRSMPKHDGWLTIVFCGLPLFSSVLAGVESWRALRKGEVAAQDMPRKMVAGWAVGFFLLSGSGFLLAEGLLTDRYMRAAQLENSEFVKTPDDWLPRDEAENIYRPQWCEKQDINWLACGSGPLARDERGAPLPDPDYLIYQRRLWCSKVLGMDTDEYSCRALFDRIESAYISDWKGAREAELAALPSRDLSNVDLRRANLYGVVLEGVDLRNSHMEMAHLILVKLGGADLSYAHLDWAFLGGADLRETKMEGTDLSNAQMSDADFRYAKMDGASLQYAKMGNSDLRMAYLDGADLRYVHLKGADLRYASLDWAYLDGADLSETKMEGVSLNEAFLDSTTSFQLAALRNTNYSHVILTQEQVVESFGDASVALPEGIDRPAHWPEWELPDSGENSFYTEWNKWKLDPTVYSPPFRPDGLD